MIVGLLCSLLTTHYSLLHRSEFPVDLGVEAPDLAEAGEGDEFDLFGVAGFKAHGGAGRDVEAKTTGGFAT
jgi:hypothetical protein